MARYQVLAQMMTMPKPMPIAEADTPAEAGRKAREVEQKALEEEAIDMDTELKTIFKKLGI